MRFAKSVPSKQESRDRVMSESTRPVVVAMSGGVDSSAAAVLLHQKGFEVVGISMQVWDYRKNGGNNSRATCCAPADFDDARIVAEKVGFPFYVFDFERSFQDEVITPFVGSYLSGETPNPCIECNRKVKFKELRRRAAQLGVDTIATGHYAQIRLLSDGKYGLFTGRDQTKDQSYFLYAMTQEELAATEFPVGAMTKPEVRELLARQGLKVARKAESQDICFVPDGVAEFISSQVGGETLGGELVTLGGSKVGHHQGIHNFTVGQRRGLGVSSSAPLYVLDIDPETRAVSVGPREELERVTFSVRDLHWVSGSSPATGERFLAKLRYRHNGVVCELEKIDGRGLATFRFLSRWTAVSPGQAAVFYSEQREGGGCRQLLGGGTITREPLH